MCLFHIAPSTKPRTSAAACEDTGRGTSIIHRVFEAATGEVDRVRCWFILLVHSSLHLPSPSRRWSVPKNNSPIYCCHSTPPSCRLALQHRLCETCSFMNEGGQGFCSRCTQSASFLGCGILLLYLLLLLSSSSSLFFHHIISPTCTTHAVLPPRFTALPRPGTDTYYRTGRGRCLNLGTD